MHKRDDLEELQKLLGVQFRDVGLLNRARTDQTAASWCYDCEDEGVGNNRMMEFLGDSTLGMVLSWSVYYLVPNASMPGVIDKILSGDKETKNPGLKTNEMLGRIGLYMGLGPFVHVADDEGAWYGTCQIDVLANVMEALIAAIFEDCGSKATRKFVERFILCHFDPETRIVSRLELPQVLLEGLVKDRDGHAPAYLECGKGDDEMFEVEVDVGDGVFIPGHGPTVPDAKTDAALRALKQCFSQHYPSSG